ncbi:MAG TPA: hypothetical protein VFC33_16480 [Acidimicrobiia bacterium]|nr:hypothetical protein [Acidimicrobiia bacterium]
MRRPWAVRAARVTSSLLLGVPLLTTAVPRAAAATSPPAAATLPRGTELLDVRTVPPVAQASFTFAGTRFTTDPATGNAWLLVTDGEGRALAADRAGRLVSTAAATIVLGPGLRARFTGWSDVAQTADVVTRTAMFEVETFTTFRFVDAHGRVIEPSARARVVLRSSVGTWSTIDDVGGAWLPTSRVVVTAAGNAVSVPIRYTASRARADGYVVPVARPSTLDPASQHQTTVVLRCFDVRLTASRSFFGDRVDSLRLRYPGGTTRRVVLDGHGRALLRCVAAGRYAVSGVGGSMVLTRTINVARDVRARVLDVSDVDLAVLAVLFGANVVAVILYVRHRRGRRPERVVP